MNIQGTNLENIKGELLIQDLVYKEKDINLKMDSLAISISRSLTSDTVIVRSDFIDIDLSGKFDLTNLRNLFDRNKKKSRPTMSAFILTIKIN